MSALDKLHYDQKARSELHYRPFLASSSPIRGDEQREPNSYTTAMRSRTRARSARQRQDARQDRILLIRGGSARMEEDVMKAETREFFEMMQQEASRYDIEHEVEDEYWYGDDEDIDEPTADAESKLTEAYEHELEEMLRLEEEELTAMMMEVTLHN